jgi:3-hydroxyacyl-CoA dehydrogenase / enoyl-CoA hydratase / 3-hydroxybutyryl-CoA epimerase
MSDFQYEKDADGIVTITMDMQGQGANTMSAAYLPAMSAAMEKLHAEQELKGVVFASAKKTFFAGGDLNNLLKVERADEAAFVMVERNKAPYRELEKLPVPVVAAINGAALGGGFELCLACNHRIVVDALHAVVGLPEVTLGLLPGAGGVVRLTALLGLEKALPLLLEGKQLRPSEALKQGLVDELVPTVADLVPAAKAWIKTNPGAHTQPWDQKGFKYPGGGAVAPNIRQIARLAPMMLVNKTRGLMPAPEKILDIAVNSMRMGFDAALRAESRGLTALMATKEAKAAITTFFFGMQAIKSGKVRPAGERWQARTSAVLGAGMMGAGIAWAQAGKGLPTVLKDMTLEQAEKGKAYSVQLADKAIKRGSMTPEKKAALLRQITPATSDEAYRDCDLIIEAVFEDIDLKEQVIPASFKMLSSDGIYGSNTSSLPISILAESCPDPTRFIGLHFFSPVDRMKIVEIILGKKTSEDTLRKAYDYVQQIGYMPIVVNDSRGFFTSRVFSTFMDEGLQLMHDGMNPVAIERAAWKVGMPVGPLAVHDEVSMELSRKAILTHRKLDERLGVKSGIGAYNSASVAISAAMCELKRGGRHYGGGFYEYGADGSKKLWSGLSQFKLRDAQVSMADAEDRLLYRQAIETLRCLDEGVLRSETEGNLGSIFAIGFPAHTGGALQFVRGIGIARFAARAAELAQRYGERFAIKESALAKLRQSKSLEV